MPAECLPALKLELKSALKPQIFFPDLLFLLGVGSHLSLVFRLPCLELSFETEDLLPECIDVVGQVGRCITVVEFVHRPRGRWLGDRLVQFDLEGPEI